MFRKNKMNFLTENVLINACEYNNECEYNEVIQIWHIDKSYVQNSDAGIFKIWVF